MTRAKTLPFFCIATASVALSAPAAAQTIDYGQFQTMFGEPISTSATGSPQRASEVPADMTIIPGESLRKLGAKNIAEALRGIAGIDVTRFAAQHYDVAVRGGNQPFNPRLLVMINGRQIYLDHYGFTSWSNLGIELSEIRQIEIVRGPVSALFGFNAASGAINIITYNPVIDQINSVSAQIGSDGNRLVSGVGTVRLGENGGVRFSGGYAEEDEFALVVPRGRKTPYRENLALDAQYDLSNDVTARINYSYSHANQAMEAISLIPLTMDIRTHGIQGTIGAETGIGLVEASLNYNSLSNDVGITGTITGPFRLKSNVLVAKIQNIMKPSARDIVRTSLEYRTNRFTVTPDLSGQISYDVYSGGLMWDHHLSDALTLNLSGRVDRLALSQSGAIGSTVALQKSDFDRNLTTWSANAGLVFKPDPQSTVRLQAARGVQIPSLISFGAAVDVEFFGGVAAQFRGNPQVDPTIVESAEIGYSRTLAALNGDLSTTIFATRTSKVTTLDLGAPVFTPTGPLLLGAFSNSGTFKTYGAEMVLRSQVSEHLRWRLDYTFNVVKQDFRPYVSPSAQPFDALTPRHKLGMKLTYEKGAVTVTGQGLLRSRVVYPSIGRESGWTFGLNMRTAWRPAKGVELFAVGENLTGAHYIDNGGMRQDVRGRMGVGFSF